MMRSDLTPKQKAEGGSRVPDSESTRPTYSVEFPSWRGVFSGATNRRQE